MNRRLLFSRSWAGLRLAVLLTWGLLSSALAQTDTLQVKTLYDQALEFDESKIDSFPLYIARIDSASEKLAFPKGEVLSERLRGIQAELSGDYQAAITHYLNCLDISRKNGWDIYEDCALSDLGIVYTNSKNPTRAKEYYKQAVDRALKKGETFSVVNSLTNLGAICNMLRQTDSALIYLNQALDYARKDPGFTDLVSLRNNLGNAWFARAEYDKALTYFRENHLQSIKAGDSSQLWYDVLNMGDVMIELKRYDSARSLIDRAMKLAIHLGSRRKVADVEQLNAKYYERIGDYKKAFSALREWSIIDTSLINSETRQTLLEMEERFKSRQREQENKLLQTQVEAGRFRSRNLMIGLWSSIALIAASIVFIYLNRKKNHKLEEKNRLIEAQNEKLADLNAEKNSLISMVSHDLHTPFTTIQMWSQVLESDRADWNEEQQKALGRIRAAAENGARMISRVLDVEAADVDKKRIQLESLSAPELLRDLADSYRMEAAAKEITIVTPGKDVRIDLLTDKQLLERAVANLLSNALKYSPAGSRIFLLVDQSEDLVRIHVQDEGPGISAEDQARLFGKYTKADNKPTGDEKSTGLGLYIVRRIMDELQGSVRCESTPGEGTRFTLELRA